MRENKSREKLYLACMVSSACKPSTQEVEAKGSGVQDHPQPQSKVSDIVLFWRQGSHNPEGGSDLYS